MKRKHKLSKYHDIDLTGYSCIFLRKLTLRELKHHHVLLPFVANLRLTVFSCLDDDSEDAVEAKTIHKTQTASPAISIVS